MRSTQLFAGIGAQPKRIRGGSGLGDSIYLRPIVEYFIAAGCEVTVMSYFPDVFAGTGAKVEPFNRIRINVTAHYPQGKYNTATNQWEDICTSARVNVPLETTWKIRNKHLVTKVKDASKGRPIVLVVGGRNPMGRPDRFGIELLPTQKCFDTVLANVKDCFTIRVGRGSQIYGLKTDMDMNDKTTVADLLDLAKSCDAIIGQCSFAIPLAEIFNKLFLGVWASAGLLSNQPYIKSITPKKVLSKPTSLFVMDDWTKERLDMKTDQFRLRVKYDHEQNSRPLRPGE